MAALTSTEVRPGLVVYQEPSVLKACSGCWSNVISDDVIVDRKGPFLVLEEQDKGWLTVPLFSNKNETQSDRVELDRSLKEGFRAWTESDSFYSKFQFWIIPTHCLVAASIGVEFSQVGSRNTFGKGQESALASVLAYKDDSAAGYRQIST